MTCKISAVEINPVWELSCCDTHRVYFEKEAVCPVAAERERCARIADAETTEGDPYCCIPLAAEIAEKIRSGG